MRAELFKRDGEGRSMRPESNFEDQPPPTPEQWAERHDGLFTSAVAAAAGLSPQQLSRRRASGRLRSIRPGVNAIGGAPQTRRQAIRAVALTVADDVCLSHEAAAWSMGAPCPSEDVIHVSGPLARVVRLPGVRAHRTGTFEDGDVISRDGMRCTSPLRTVRTPVSPLLKSERTSSGTLEVSMSPRIVSSSSAGGGSGSRRFIDSRRA